MAPGAPGGLRLACWCTQAWGKAGAAWCLTGGMVRGPGDRFLKFAETCWGERSLAFSERKRRTPYLSEDPYQLHYQIGQKW